MAKNYKVQAPDGSVIQLEGPENATEEQLIQAAQAAYAQRTQAPRSEISVVFPGEEAPPMEPATTVTGVAGAAARGMALPTAGATLGAALGAPLAGVGAIPGAIVGGGAGALTQFVGDPIVDLVNRTLGTKYRRPTEAMEDLLTRIGVPQPQTEAERIVQATSSGLAGAGGTAALGRALEMAAGAGAPVMAGAGRALAAQPAQQLAGGAGAGFAAQTAQEMGAGPVGQIAAALGGGVLGATAAAPRRALQPSPIADVTQEATSRGIPVMTSDVRQPRTFMGRAGQQVGERIPLVGTGPLREQQQAQRISAVRDVLRQFGAEDAANLPDSIMRDLANKRSALLTRYSGLKGEVAGRMDSLGPVPVPRTVAAIESKIRELRSLRSDQYAPVIRILEDWSVALQNPVRTQTGQVQRFPFASGIPQTTTAKGQTFSNVELLRKQLGESFEAPELSSIRTTGKKVLSDIYSPLKQDMESFIANVGQPNDLTKWKVANARLSELAGELDMGALKSVLRSGKATPESVQNLLFSKKPSEVRALYSGLTTTGRANGRAAILSKAADDARFTNPDGSVSYSPERFMQSIKRLEPQIGVFFKGEDRAQIGGLARALNLTRRAGEAPVLTSTGQQAVPFLAGGFLVDLLGTAGAATATAGGIGLMARVYESAPVRNLMIQLGRTKPNSAEEAALLKRLISTMQIQADKVESATEGE